MFRSSVLRSLRNVAPSTRAFSTSAVAEAEKKIALIGARGYTGQALISLVNAHPSLVISHVSSRELAGKPLDGYSKAQITYSNLSPEDIKNMEAEGEVDAWVMALPNGVCKPMVESVLAGAKKAGKKNSVVVDLSADYRFDEPRDTNWIYGLPELNDRSKISQATLISNPGCYATGAQLALAPLIPHLSSPPTVFGVSGYSGAGTKPSPKNDTTNLQDNLIPYSLTDHIHEREISHRLGSKVAFIPHVGQWFQGISLTVSIPLAKTMTSREIRNLYTEFYASEKLVEIIGEEPSVKDIAGQHGVRIGGFGVNQAGDRVVVVATIDNLLKGAATQCLQNLNLALGVGEFDGIPLMGSGERLIVPAVNVHQK
ncbi:putative acetylglutamate kinase [Saitoella complicata NRRL Y-17804]|nr:putative acetylglutamate kinase [Saitoella complicata NRRL Y-17804]ODQ56288.1 putative acetylglutamate kinase [Saitoella complicata NRRL Y-17804]